VHLACISIPLTIPSPRWLAQMQLKADGVHARWFESMPYILLLFR
jgi:hypothetical protein